MRKLDRIKVRNFKSIRELDIELDYLNVLIGANGVGKSNFIQIFKFLNRILERQLQQYVAENGGADSILHFGKKKSDFIELKLAFADETTSYENGYEIRLTPSVEDSLFFANEKVWFHDKARHDQPFYNGLGTGHKESQLANASKATKISSHVINDLRSWKLYHFHDTSDSAKIKQTVALEDNRVLNPDAGNLAAFLYRLEKKHPAHFANITDVIRMVAPFFEGFDLHPSLLNEDRIRLEWKEVGSDSYFGVSSISDGTLRFMCLTTLLLQPDLPSMIILDEPELGLHPAAIVILAELLRSASQRTQVVVATQSVTLVNQFTPEDTIVLDRQDGQTTFSRLDKQNMEDWLDEYGLGDLWEKNIVGGRP